MTRENRTDQCAHQYYPERSTNKRSTVLKSRCERAHFTLQRNNTEELNESYGTNH